ncbi:hypothetical protein CALVIDRAFT_598079 [Calocera viscosa TUFC12733]|uniref:Wax synthase domain-containing protein n=1 Tax=Calocera viscosa (strain TUFC12733) TaxID=1330018 RepID=A0A167MQC9_CALVF|nr:hypothetical protein CALVIDRAFT_598079 [Calocera viscosa TUFC12733]
MDRIPTIPSFYPFLPPSERIPITIYTIPLILSIGAPVFLLADLARRPNTLLYRHAILAFAGYWCLYVMTGFRWMSMDMAPWNFALGLWCLMAFAKTVEYGTNTTGFRRLDEPEPVSTYAPTSHTNGDAKPSTNGHASIHNGTTRNGDAPSRSVQAPAEDIFEHRIGDTLDLVCFVRGVGWAHGEGTYIPPFPFPSLSGPELRRKWLRYAAMQFLMAFLLFDAVEVALKQHPNFRSPGPASMFVSSLPPLKRFGLATATSLATGIAVVLGFQSAYYFFGFCCVLFKGDDPRSWPPIQDAPWFATSLHDFWAKKWHQLLRRSFLVMGGYPLQYLISPLLGPAAGEIAAVVGVFLASGLLHMLAQFPIGLPLQWGSVLFFLMQGAGVGLERVFRIVTGKHVGGVAGWVWVAAWVVLGGILACEDWHMHGLGAGIVIPPMFSPLRAVILPLGRRLWGQS